MLNNHLNVEDFAVEMNEDSLTTVVILSGSQVSLLEHETQYRFYRDRQLKGPYTGRMLDVYS